MSMTEPPVPHEPPVLNRQPHIRVAKSSYGGGLLRKLNASIRSNWYETFDPAEAKRLTDKLEIHYTPKHGSWLNIAEIELSALSRQCLDRRIADTEILKREVAAWKAGRNDAKTRVRWRSTTANARIKLHRLYPSSKP